MPITDFDVTYGAAIAPPGYHRVTGLDGHSADVNAHSGGVGQTYLWYHKGPNKGAPIVDVDVVHDDESVPEGWEKVARDMRKGSSESSFICFRRSKGEKDEPLPLAEVKIAYGDEQPEGFTRLDKSLCKGEKPLYLCYKRATEATADAVQWSPSTLQVGDRVDMKHMFGKWVVAQVVSVSETEITVRPKGMRMDQSLPRDSARLAALGTHTSGADGGQATLVQGQPWTVGSEELSAFVERLTEAAGYMGLLSSCEELDHLAKVDIPSFIEAALSSSFARPQHTLPEILKALHKALQVLSRLLAELGTEPMPPAVQRALSMLLANEVEGGSQGGGCYMYRMYGNDEAFVDEWLGRYHTVMELSRHHRQTPYFSSIYVIMLNLWANEGGYRACSWRLYHAPLYETPVYAGWFSKLLITENLAIKNLGTFIAQAGVRAGQRFDRVTNEELSAISRPPHQDVLEKLDHNVHRMLYAYYSCATERRQQDKDRSQQQMERFYFHTGRRLLVFSFLPFRIRGLSMLNEIAEHLSRRQPSKPTSSMWNYGREVAQDWWTFDKFVEWLVEDKMVELVLGDPEQLKQYKLQDTHYELVRRIETFVECLLIQGALTEQHIEVMWRATLNQADTMVRQVYKLLGNIASKLPAQHLPLLVEHIKELPQPYEDFHVELIVSLVEAVAQQRKYPWAPQDDVGFALLWGVAMGEGRETKPEVVEGVTDAVVNLLKRAECTGRFALQCVEAVREGRPAVHALRLLRRLLDSQTVYYSTDEPTRAKIIKGLSQRVDGLLRVLVEDLCRFRKAAKAAADSEGLLGQDEALDTVVPGMRMTVKEGLELRLDLMKYIAVNSEQKLSFEDHIEDLIAMLVGDAMCPAETEVLLGWFATLGAGDERTQSQYRYTSPNICMSRETAVKVFKALFATPEGARSRGLDLATLGENGYDCLWKYFRAINEWEKALDCRTGMPSLSVVVRRFDLLEGLAVIEEVCLNAVNSSVSEKALSFFMDLHSRIEPQVKVQRVAIWEGVVRRCMDRIPEQLADDKQQPEDGSNLVLVRSLTLLRRLLEELMRYKGEEVVDQLTFEVHMYKDGEDHLPGKMEKYTVEAGQVTLGQLRAKIAQDMGCPGNCLRLSWHGRVDSYINSSRKIDTKVVDLPLWKQISEFDATVLPDPEDDTLSFDLTTTPAHRHEEDPPRHEAAGELLANTPQYFDRLFSLLEHDNPEVVQNAWTIIKMLPAHRDTRERLTSAAQQSADGVDEHVDDVSWPDLLYGHAPLRLLYVLQLIGDDFFRHVGPAARNPAKYEPSCRWLLWFVKAGGFEYLLGVLIMWTVEGQCESTLIKMALSELIKVVANFVVMDESMFESPCNRKGRSNPCEVLEDVDDDDEARPDVDNDDGPVDMRVVHRATAGVFAAVDRHAMVSKLIEIMAEVTKSARPSTGQNEQGKESGSSDRWGQGGGGSSGSWNQQQQPAGAIGHDLASPVNRTGSEPSRNLLRRPSWTYANEWTRDLFDSPMRRDHPDDVRRSEELSVIKCAFCLLSSIDSTTDIIAQVLSSGHARTLLRYGLLRSDDQALRRAVARGVHKLCVEARRRQEESSEGSDRSAEERGMDDVVKKMIVVLMELLKEVTDGEGGCEEFFVLLTRLISAPDALKAPMEPLALTLDLANHIKQRRLVEASEDDQDKLLTGLIAALRALLAFMPDDDPATIDIKRAVGSREGAGLLDELLHVCLFAVPTTDAALKYAEGPAPPKCKHPESREAALGLVLELSTGFPENLLQVIDAVEGHHSIGLSAEEKERRKARVARKRKNTAQSALAARRRSSPTTNMFSSQQSLPYTTSKSRTGYVGLKNLGCICYLNSTLQQLYMIKGLREGILAFEDQEEDKDESLMYQLQTLFAHLQESHKGYYNPTGFCQALKNWDGEPTDPFVQQDAQEFLSLFFQRVEGLIQGTRCETVLKDYFGGTYSNELIADEGRKYSERPEPFLFISLPVRNMRTLNQALEDYIAGETVDYSWDNENEHGEVVKEMLKTEKRMSFKTLPSHLIIHLKRFDFDFETMQQIKINDRLEFPQELDMRPYTVEGRKDAHVRPKAEDMATRETQQPEERPPQYYRYRLAGVVVHMGTAHSGHYYSYIKERTGKRRWIEFNDTFVAEFNAADLEVECFGGQETTSYGRGMSGGSWMRERIRNAFMLLYDREDLDQETHKRRHSFRPSVPHNIMEEILRENVEFWRKTNILTERYFDFMKQLLQPSDAIALSHPDLYLREIQLATKFALGTLVEAKQVNFVEGWVQTLEEHYARCPAARMWLLQTLCRDQETLKDLLVESEDWRVRAAAGKMVECALAGGEGDVVGIDGDGEGDDSRLCVLRSLLSMLRVGVEGTMTRTKFAGLDACMDLLARVLEGSERARMVVLESPMEDEQQSTDLVTVIQIFVAPALVDRDSRRMGLSPEEGEDAGNQQQQQQRMGPLKPALALLSVLLLSCRMPGAEEDSPLLEPPRYVLTEVEEKALCSTDFMYVLASQVTGWGARQHLRGLFEHMLWENEDMEHSMCEGVLQGIEDEEGQPLMSFFRALMLLLDVPDSRHRKRVDYVMPRLLQVLMKQQKYIRATELGLQMLVRIGRQCPEVQEWFKRTKVASEPGDRSPQGPAIRHFWGHRASPEPPNVYPPEVSWAFDFLRQRLDSGGVVLHGQSLSKLKRSMSNSPQWGYNSRARQDDLQALHDALDLLATGEELPKSYDSDTDPESIVGSRIRMLWARDTMHFGRIKSYDPETNKHIVEYDDKERREYILAEKAAWDIVAED